MFGIWRMVAWLGCLKCWIKCPVPLGVRAWIPPLPADLYAPFLEMFKARLGWGPGGSLILLVATLPITGDWNKMGLKGPFQPEPFYNKGLTTYFYIQNRLAILYLTVLNYFCQNVLFFSDEAVFVRVDRRGVVSSLKSLSGMWTETSHGEVNSYPWPKVFLDHRDYGNNELSGSKTYQSLEGTSW